MSDMPELLVHLVNQFTRQRSVWTTAAVAILLALYLVMALGGSLEKGPSFDEEEELTVGYNIWHNADFRLEGADGDLIKRWATLPYLISRPHLAINRTDFWRNGRTYRFGFQFFFLNGNEPESLLLQGRAMNALLGAFTGFLIFYCSRELFGTLGGIFSLLLFVFSPHMLAFGGMVSTEISICLMLLGATWSVWRLLHRVTWKRLALGVMFISLLVLAKPSALVIFPITFILILAKLFSGRPLEWQLGRPRIIHSPLAQLGVFAGLLLVHTLIAWIVLWAHYDFRFAASPVPNDPTIIFTNYVNSDPVNPQVAGLMNWLRVEHLLPEGFLQGIHTLLTSNDQRQAFMDGQWTIGGWRSFFLHSLWDKTSPALILLFGGGMVGWGILRYLSTKSTQLSKSDYMSVPYFYEAIPYFVMAGVYFLIAVLQNVNIGHRHILPIYSAIYILSGGTLGLVWLQSKYIPKIIVALLLAWFALESVFLFPHYLAYFNPLVGGPAKGYLHLVDSSLDWGMDLPGVKKWLDKNNPNYRDPVYLAYFGTDSPEYQGIRTHRLPGNPEWRDAEVFPYSPGIYVISATLYESLYEITFGPWNSEYEEIYQSSLRNVLMYEASNRDPVKLASLLQLHPQKYWDNEYGKLEQLRFGRLCAWLRHFHPTPDAAPGYSILIWRLNQQDLQSALFGPPAEIDDSPLF